MRSDFTFKSYFGRIFYSIVSLILVALFITGLMFYAILSSNAKENFYVEQGLRIKDMENSINNKLLSIQNDVLDLAVFGDSFSPTDQYEYKYESIVKQLSSLLRKHSLISSAYYYDIMRANIINSTAGIYPISEFNDKEWYGFLDYRPRLYYLPIRKNIDSTVEESTLPSTSYTPENVFTMVYGSIYSNSYVVNISVEGLLEAINSIFPCDGENISLSVYSDTDEDIAAYGDKTVFNGTFLNGSLKYTICYLQSATLTGFNSYLRFFLIAGFIMLIILSLVAFYLSRKIYNPINDMFESVSLNMFLEGNINLALFEKANPMIGDDSVYRLVVLRASNLNQDFLAKPFLNSVISAPIAHLNKGRLGILVSDKSHEALSSRMDTLASEIAGIYSDGYLAAIGNEVSDLNQLKRTYKDILELIHRCEFFEISNRFVYCEDQKTDKTCPQTISYEAGFISSIINNDVEAMAALSGKLFEEFEDQSEYYARNTLQEIFISLDRELNLSQKLTVDIKMEPSDFKTISEYRNFLDKLLCEAGELYKVSESAETRYAADAKAFLEANYRKNIDILQVAEALHLSYPYLSKIFKNIYQITLSDYLNSYRIEKSCELLDNTDYTLNKISELIGYNNSQSYQRFFKKYKGITPTEYRRRHGS